MEYIRLEKTAGYAAIVLHRPQQLNALHLPLMRELEEALDALAADAAVRCVVLTGAGEKAFAAGADIARLAELNEETAVPFTEEGHRIVCKLEAFRAPTIAAINGYALGGGCELSLACDMRVASDNAVLGLPETGLGIFPGWGGTQRLPRLVGHAKAARMIFGGGRLNAQEALAIGLVDEVVPKEALAAHVAALAQSIAAQAPLAVQAAKRAMLNGAGLPMEKALEVETAEFSGLFSTKDAKQGLAAFLRKEKHEFTGT